MKKDERRAHNEGQIRAAIERLLSGHAIHTDGTRNATTLAAEAGVYRQDLYRSYRLLLDEFREHLRRTKSLGGRATGERRRWSASGRNCERCRPEPVGIGPSGTTQRANATPMLLA